MASFRFKIDRFSWAWSFLVSLALGVDCVFGAYFIIKRRLILDIQGHHCYFKLNRQIFIPFLGYPSNTANIHEVYCPDQSRDQLIPSQKSTHNRLCEKFPSVLTSTLGLVHLLQYKIELTDDKVPLSHPKMSILRQKIQKLLEHGP